jgi:hypothetical protein
MMNWTKGSKWRQRGELTIRATHAVRANTTSEERLALAMDWLPEFMKRDGGIPELPSRVEDRESFTHPVAFVGGERPLTIGCFIEAREIVFQFAYQDERKFEPGELEMAEDLMLLAKKVAKAHGK